MKKTLQCPKCDSRKLWRIETMVERGHRADQTHPMALTVEHRRWTLGEKATGTFETFICAECGYTEWYASGLDKLEAAPGKGVHFIDNEPEGGLR